MEKIMTDKKRIDRLKDAILTPNNAFNTAYLFLEFLFDERISMSDLSREEIKMLHALSSLLSLAVNNELQAILMGNIALTGENNV